MSDSETSDGGCSAVLSNVGLGPWVPERDTGYNAHARPWVLRRRNPKWWGGVQTMHTAGCKERRWSTEEAAKKVANTENGSNAK